MQKTRALYDVWLLLSRFTASRTAEQPNRQSALLSYLFETSFKNALKISFLPTKLTSKITPNIHPIQSIQFTSNNLK